MTWYMTVTADKFEFPILIEDTAADLARKLGIRPNLVYTSISHNTDGSRKGYKFVKVVFDEE